MNAPALPLGLASLLGLLTAGTTLIHAPEEGSTVRRTFEQTMSMELVGHTIEVEINGEPAEAEAPEIEVRLGQEETLVVVDEIVSVGEEGLVALKRTFESLKHTDTQDVSGEGVGEGPGPIEQTSALEGRQVAFSLEDGEWSAAWADEEEGEADLLEDLEADGGFAFLLPEGEVEVGAEWELGTDAFLLLGEPFGGLHFKSEDDDGEEDDFDEQFEDNLDLESFVCTLESVEDGVATITFELEATTGVEQEDELPEEAQAMGMEASTELEFGFVMEGTLTWDVEQRRMIDLEVEGETTMTIRNLQEADSGEFTFQAEATQEFEGTLSWSASAE